MDSSVYKCRKLILATGGKSYPMTGSTGDGYSFAKSLGHSIVKPRASLVGLIVRDKAIRDLAGLTLKNVEIKFYVENEIKPFYKDFGEMLFTHAGISGPIVLTASKYVGEKIDMNKTVYASLDLKPAISDQELKDRINRDIVLLGGKEVRSLLIGLIPKALIDIVAAKCNINQHSKAADLKKETKQQLVNCLKNFQIRIDALEPIEVAIITCGGVNIKEIDPKTMESKIVPNLYLVGEMLDLDGPTGGYNLQFAISSALLC